MRSGGCTVQQALTAEAASTVKQAVVLAKRRGHAQVTPLHVANTMLSSSTGLLRTACLQSHSHPLQCKALELCFNVALNRLPTSSSSSSSPMMLGHQHQHQHPSISNALVAAFKRAQAHQRRGSVENQQQPLLAVKIDLEQLIISILDDPSVSRVMREAGFSSTQVKINVEQAVSLELSSQNNPSPNINGKPKENNNHVFLSKASNKVIAPSFPVNDEDVMSVVESLMNKRRKAIVIVGECLGSLEGVIKGVMEKVDKEIKLISVPLSTFANIQREEVEQRIGELTCLVKSLVNKGVVLYLGDLKWITDYRANNNNSSGQGNNFSYCFSVEHMIMELGRLVCNIGENGKLWLVGIATFQTYMRCRSGHNSLESIWGLHPITIPAASLGLSLNSDSDTQLELRSKTSENGSSGMIIDSEDQEKQILTCCADCSAKYEAEVLNLQNSASNIDSTLSSLPSWLKDERQRLNNSHHDQSCVSMKELCKKWNTICNSSHKKTKTFERSLTFPSTSPSSSMITCFSLDQQYTNLHHSHHLPFLDPEQTWREKGSTRLRIYIPESPDPRNVFSSNPNSTPNSSSSSDIMEMEYIPKFKEFNSENLNILSNALYEKVPWQKDIIREISGTILRCRSGMIKRKEKCSGNYEAKEETWLFFQGHDVQAKEKIARELAMVVFGSYSKFISLDLSSFSSTKTDSCKEYFRNKRSRDEQSSSYIERFVQAVSSNPHRVLLVEDVEQVDYCSQRRMKKAIERGKITNSSGEEVSLSDAIIILSCESFSCRSRGVSPVKQKSTDGSDNEDKGEAMEESRSSPCISLDLNISIDDHQSVEQSIDDVSLLESVDRCVIFRIQ
ncbi:PREDICTED: protein SMAX1-LIKE 3-like [Nicotiana attenuata]|uniref:Protein smax1-like 3 n=1 Tax=Nicotiana attenuata TaxID=49451 RepID=A0A1J6IJP2_NICAT|nr:PREDICTED: protein SMAX1-LIKE 3-like [Nicotiana attenuata]OIT00752.1 protein smax1-like 3 [Nicotiana attenuata]